MDLEGLVINKGLKGKQNKKKWNKNIDVSGLLQKIQNDNIEETRRKYAKPLIVEDTLSKERQELNPDRFKNRLKSQPKPKYDNSYKRDNLIEDGMQDLWTSTSQPSTKKKQELIVPAIIKPSSGHSYNPKKQHIEEIIDEVIDFEKPRPRKQKKIKKIKETQVIKRVRNKQHRQEFLLARQRKAERETLNQINSMKKLKKQIDERQKKTEQKIQQKQAEQSQRLQQYKVGKVRQGPKIGKLRYAYRQYIPSQQELNKKISKVGLSTQLMKEQYDSIFRRGIMEPRTVKVHANKTKNIKVKERFQSDL